MVAQSGDDVRMEADAPDIIVNRISDAVYPDIDVIGWRESVFRWLDRRTLSGKIIISLATLLAGIAYLIITLRMRGCTHLQHG